MKPHRKLLLLATLLAASSTLALAQTPAAGDAPAQPARAERMDPEFIAYMAGLKPGEEFDPDDLERANKRLSRLEVFRALRVEEGAELGPGGTLPIIVSVQERAPRRFGVGEGLRRQAGE